MSPTSSGTASSWTSRSLALLTRDESRYAQGRPVAVHMSKMLGQPSAAGAVIGSRKVRSNLPMAMNGMVRRLRWGMALRLARCGIAVAERASFRPRKARSLGTRSTGAQRDMPFHGLDDGR